MILPTTYGSGLLLLLVSFVCWGLWISTFKLAGPRWRFELYSVDFAVGVALVSLLAAFTLGTVGSDLAFSDRLLVAGRASQAFVMGAGFLFNLGNMLLLAAVSLLGISGAFPIAIGLAVIISSILSFGGTNALFLISGLVLILAAVLTNIAACRARGRAVKKPSKPEHRKTGKGIFIALLSGAMLGFFYPLGVKGMTGDLALGPYAGMLMFSVGILVSTVLFDFYFLNIAIEGGPLKSSAYFQGKAPQHLLGFGGGALWALGALAALLAIGGPVGSVPASLKLVLPVGSVLLAIAFGAWVWKEFKAAPGNAKVSLGLAAALFAGGLVLTAIGFSS